MFYAWCHFLCNQPGYNGVGVFIGNEGSILGMGHSINHLYQCIGSPGVVAMGRDSRSEGCGFESRHRILDGHFSHIFFVVKIVMFA